LLEDGQILKTAGQRNAARQGVKNFFGHIKDDQLQTILRIPVRDRVVLRTVVQRGGFIKVAVGNPSIYFGTMYTSSAQWAVFGASGVSVLIPFGYAPDTVINGHVVEKGGLYFGFRDPITGLHYDILGHGWWGGFEAFGSGFAAML